MNNIRKLNLRSSLCALCWNVKRSYGGSQLLRHFFSGMQNFRQVENVKQHNTQDHILGNNSTTVESGELE